MPWLSFLEVADSVATLVWSAAMALKIGVCAPTMPLLVQVQPPVGPGPIAIIPQEATQYEEHQFVRLHEAATKSCNIYQEVIA